MAGMRRPAKVPPPWGGPRAALIQLAGAGGGAQPGPRGTFQEARGGSKKSAGDALVPRAAAATTGTAQVTASYLFGYLNPDFENQTLQSASNSELQAPETERGVLGSPQGQGTEGCRGDSEVPETSGAKDLETSEPESQVPQVSADQGTEPSERP